MPKSINIALPSPSLNWAKLINSNATVNNNKMYYAFPTVESLAILSEEDIRLFKEKAKKAKISPIVIHIPYTLNLAATREGFHKITIREFIQDLLEADKLGADYLITHMGSYKGSTEERGLIRIVKAIEKILKATLMKAFII